MDKRMHIIAVATNEYVGFIPLFLHYMFKAYPDYYVIIFVRDMPDSMWDVLRNHEHSAKFSIIDGELEGYPQIEREDSTALKYLLFTTDRVEKYFYGVEYAYIADIDVLYYREDPGILESHLEHCKRIGLPYSNCIRANVPPTITGVYFVTREYIDRIQEVSDVWDTKFREHGIRLIKTPQRVRDERILYELVVDSGMGLPPSPPLDDLGFTLDPTHPRFRPAHGINIGFARHPELLRYTERNNAALKKVLPLMHDEYFDLIPDWGKKAWGHICDKWSSE